MNASPPTPADLSRPNDLAWLKQRQMPAWVLSMLLHFVTLTILSVTMKGSARGVIGGESERGGGIALASSSGGGGTEYTFDESSTEGAASNSTAAVSSSASSDQAFPDASEAPAGSSAVSDGSSGGGLAGALPGEFEGNGGGDGSGTAGSAGTTGGKSGVGDGKGAQTQVFGVKGQGNRFVYVFDRSSSMAGYEGRPIRSAKQELLASLKNLTSIHQFQVIFYNQDPYVMNPFGNQSPQMLFANDSGKRAAANFVSGVTADGSTSHVRALKMALRMRPDVIFFLTDADEPQMTVSELREIRTLNHGCHINSIEFGAGPSPNRFNFLKRLAEENEGNYGYVDILKLPAR